MIKKVSALPLSLLALLLISCNRVPEVTPMITFSCEGGKLGYVFEMTGETSQLPLEEGETGWEKVRFTVAEGEWVDFAFNRTEKTFTYQAHFTKDPNYSFNFERAEGNHHFWQGPDPEVQSIMKLLNSAKQGGTFYWK